MAFSATKQLIQRDLDQARLERNHERKRCSDICREHSFKYNEEGKLVIAEILKNIANEIQNG